MYLIEIHGCNTGSIDEGEDAPFAQVLSQKLGAAGKNEAFVIAHATQMITKHLKEMIIDMV